MSARLETGVKFKAGAETGSEAGLENSKQTMTGFHEEVYSIVAQIPEGKVLSYGQVAKLMGRPQNARMVGQAMWGAPPELALPCHRVVNSQGRIAPTCPQHREMLARESVTFRRNGYVDLTKHAWLVNDEL